MYDMSLDQCMCDMSLDQRTYSKLFLHPRRLVGLQRVKETELFKQKCCKIHNFCKKIFSKKNIYKANIIKKLNYL